MRATDWVFTGFLVFVGIWLCVLAWGLHLARKQVDKINTELDERDARWSELGDARWPGPHWPDGPPP